MGKKGMLRIVEASLAVLLVFGVILVVASKREAGAEKEDINKILREVLDEVAKKNDLREKIVNGDELAKTEIKDILEKRIPSARFGDSVNICEELGNLCACDLTGYPEDAEGSIFSSERVISTTLDTSNPRIVKLCVWRRR